MKIKQLKIGEMTINSGKMNLVAIGGTVELKQGNKKTKFKAYYRNNKTNTIFLREVR